MSRTKKIGIYLFIAALSALMTACWCGFRHDGFLADDNRTQWYMVMQPAYEQFFSGDGMPVYDFYQMKGMKISEPGYYGTTNPMMTASFAAVRFLHIPFSGITVYIFTAFALGNMFMYAVCRELKCGAGLSLLAALSYSSCGAFCAFFYWYYIFNNYFMIPLIVLLVLKSADTALEFFVPGLALAFDLLLGNVQYTCFHYMIYCIICVITGALKRKRSFAAMASNIAVGIGLSAPFFILLISASSELQSNGFFMEETSILDIIFNSALPMGLLDALGLEGGDFSLFKGTVLGRTDRMLYYFASCTAPMLLFAFFYAGKLFTGIKKAKSENKLKSPAVMCSAAAEAAINGYKKLCGRDFSSKLTAALAIALLFFLFYSNGGFTAIVLSKIPVINKFRYLFKALFAAAPIAAMLTAVLIKGSSGSFGRLKKTAEILCLLFGIIGIANNYFVCEKIYTSYTYDEMSVSDEALYAEKLISDGKLDLKNYRALSIFGDSADVFNYRNNFSRNFPTYIKRFSVGAYEISVSGERSAQYGMLMPGTNFLTSYANSGTARDFANSLKNDPALTERQLIVNSVKYLIIQNPPQSGDGSYAEEIKELIASLENVRIVRAEPLNEKYSLIELEGVNSLCADENGNTVPLAYDRMDLLAFEAADAEKLFTSLAYDKGLFAYSEDGDGNRTYGKISSDSDGNAVIDAAGLSGRIYLGYGGRIYGVSFAFEIIITAAFAVFAAAALFGRREKKA